MDPGFLVVLVVFYLFTISFFSKKPPAKKPAQERLGYDLEELITDAVRKAKENDK